MVFSHTSKADIRICDAPGCDLPGEYCAPRSRDRLREYYWFCLQHVREYNARWNYYADMSEHEIECDRREDVCWHRPTWSMAERALRRKAFAYAGLHDTVNANGVHGAAAQNLFTPRSKEGKAMQVFDLQDEDFSLPKIKLRYKQLVKRYHPDAIAQKQGRNDEGAVARAEEQLKIINQSYTILKNALTHTQKVF
ncbi:MAG: J domain-containing protein [Pseudomonadota bacterium]